MSLDTYPSAQVEAMQARIAALEGELEQAREDRARAAMDARNPLLARLAELEAQNKDLRDRFAEVDTGKNAALNCVREATGAVLRLAPLEAEAKQARDDEAWAHLHAVPIHRRGDGWVAEHFDGSQVRDAEAPTIAAALRALRAKVEGGAR